MLTTMTKTMMKLPLLALSLALFQHSFVSALTATEWKSRTIYQVITDRFALANGDQDKCDQGNCPYGNWCGGTFAGLEQKLPYIQGMGFDAIWISPVVQNLACGYHGYWGQNLSQIEYHFGGADQLQSLMTAARNAGIAVMLDIVGNHMGPSDDNGYDQFWPFNSVDHYHGTPNSHCDQPSDPNDQYDREQCWLVNLCDLKQESPYVTQQLVLWMQNLQKTYNFDGIRIDTVPYVPKVFWKALKQQALPDTYVVGEVLISNQPYEYDAGYQTSYDGGVNGPLLDGVLNYPLFWAVRDAFQNGKSLSQFSSQFSSIQQVFKEGTGLLGNFVENHDQPRWLLGNADMSTYRNAIVTAMFLPGVPIAYYGTEQNMAGAQSDNDKRQPLWRFGGYDQTSSMYLWTKKLVGARKKMLSTLTSTNFDNIEYVNVLNDDQVFVFQRGGAVVVTAHQGVTLTTTVATGLKPGSSVCDVFTLNASTVTSNTTIKHSRDACNGNGDRMDCGREGTTQQECVASGCCWQPVQPNPSNQPWCFHQNGPSPSPSAPYCVTVDGSGDINIAVVNGEPRVFLQQ